MADPYDAPESSSSARARRSQSPITPDNARQTTNNELWNYLVCPFDVVFLLFKWFVLNIIVLLAQYFLYGILPALTPSRRRAQNISYFISGLVITAIPFYFVYHFFILPQLDDGYSPAYFSLSRHQNNRLVERQQPQQHQQHQLSDNFIRQYAQVISHESYLYKKVWPEFEQQAQFWSQIQLENERIWSEINKTWSEIYAIDQELLDHQNQINEIKQTLRKVVFIRDLDTGNVGLLLHNENANKIGNAETMVRELIKEAVNNYYQDALMEIVDNLIQIAIKKYEESTYGIIKTAINNYHQDVLNTADFASISRGAKIMYDLTTPTYFYRSAWIQGVKWFFGVPATTNSPEMALSPQTNVGNSWAMSGSDGYLGIRLSETIIVQGITIEFPSAEVMMNRMGSAPKDIEVYGLSNQDYHHELNSNGLLLLGTIQYDIHGDSTIQTFDIASSSELFSSVLVRIRSNWGNPDFTDIYRVRIHGTPIVK